jgi:hypothetical protein
MVTLTQSVPSDASLASYYATYQSLYLFLKNQNNNKVTDPFFHNKNFQIRFKHDLATSSSSTPPLYCGSTVILRIYLASHRRVTTADLQRVKSDGLVVVGARLCRSNISLDGEVGLQGVVRGAGG